MIIGLSGKARSGKDTIGDYLSDNHKFFKLHFASALKNIVGEKLFNLSYEQLYGDLKEVVDPRWGLSPRQILQHSGTKLREVYSDIWIKQVDKIIREEGPKGVNIVVCDIRFPNEMEMLRNLGDELNVPTYLVRLERLGFGIKDNKHASETALDNLLLSTWDASISVPTGVLGLLDDFSCWFKEIIE